MMIPSIFGDDIFDEMFRYPYREAESRKKPEYEKQEKSLMRTDIRELEDSYEVDIDLPGYKKEQISAKLEKGYLTVQAVKNQNGEEMDRKGSYIRRERYAGSCSRTFYVGDALKPEDIRARYEDGILSLTVPKRVQRLVEEKRHISIEG